VVRSESARGSARPGCGGSSAKAGECLHQGCLCINIGRIGADHGSCMRAVLRRRRADLVPGDAAARSAAWLTSTECRHRVMCDPVWYNVCCLTCIALTIPILPVEASMTHGMQPF
jgi:hypothetical protein